MISATAYIHILQVAVRLEDAKTNPVATQAEQDAAAIEGNEKRAQEIQVSQVEDAVKGQNVA
jgi:hypothetical protein